MTIRKNVLRKGSRGVTLCYVDMGYDSEQRRRRRGHAKYGRKAVGGPAGRPMMATLVILKVMMKLQVINSDSKQVYGYATTNQPAHPNQPGWKLVEIFSKKC